MRLLLLGLLVSLSLPAVAQKAPASRPQAAQPGACAVGSAEAVLDAGDVRAALYNVGALFWRGSGAQYEVPVGSGLSPMFATSLWVGGRAGGELRFAGSTYGPWEFWPGPLDADGETTPERCADFDRIWTVHVDDLRDYAQTGTAARDLEDWPIAFGAPFYIDFDGDDVQDEDEVTISFDRTDRSYGGMRRINLEAGERPVIYGQQTAWWVMNDNGGEHEFSQAPALEVEVRVTAWTTGFGNALSQSTFYRYDVINRSDDVLDNVYAGVFVDADVGEFNDDYVHSDSTRQMLVFYNGDEFDDGGSGYGASPPALGIDVLSGGHAAMNVANVGPTSEPDNAVESYRYLRGVWNDGTLLREGGDGYDSAGPVVTWAFPGDPAVDAFWSMENTDGNGTRVLPSDKRGSISAEPVNLRPGEQLTVDLGVVFAQGASRLESVVDLRAVSDSAQVAYDSGRLFGRYNSGPVPPFPSAAPDLVSPEDGAAFNGTAVTFEWSAVPDAERYVLEVDSTEAFSRPERFVVEGQTQLEVSLASFPANYRGPLYWRVAGIGGGRQGPFSPRRQFTNAYFQGSVTLFEVVANAAGPITPPTGGAADFAGFPVPQRPGEEQQTTEAIWFVSAGGSDGTYPSFLDRAILSRPGNADQFDGSDYEVRFTGPSQAYRRFQDQALMEVPFEIWNVGVGTPDDPSDDYRMVPAVLDDPVEAETGGVGNGVFDLSTLDSPVSSAENDPETDWLFWYEPDDTTPGEAGYQAWLADAATAPEDHGPEVLARMTFVGWNLGTEPPYPEPYPEAGTVFRLTTSNPFNVSEEAAASGPALALEVFPNPASTRLEVRFALEAAGRARVAVYDVLGREVAVLEDGPRAAGEHRLGLEVGALSPGVYVVVLEGDGVRASRTVTVVR